MLHSIYDILGFFWPLVIYWKINLRKITAIWNDDVNYSSLSIESFRKVHFITSDGSFLEFISHTFSSVTMYIAMHFVMPPNKLCQQCHTSTFQMRRGVKYHLCFQSKVICFTWKFSAKKSTLIMSCSYGSWNGRNC